MNIDSALAWFARYITLDDQATPMWWHPLFPGMVYSSAHPDFVGRPGVVSRVRDANVLVVHGVYPLWYPWYCLAFRNTVFPEITPPEGTYEVINEEFARITRHFRVWREWNPGQFGLMSDGRRYQYPSLFDNMQTLPDSHVSDEELEFESGHSAPFWAIAPEDACFAAVTREKSIHAKPLPLP